MPRILDFGIEILLSLCSQKGENQKTERITLTTL